MSLKQWWQNGEMAEGFRQTHISWQNLQLQGETHSEVGMGTGLHGFQSLISMDGATVLLDHAMLTRVQALERTQTLACNQTVLESGTSNQQFHHMHEPITFTCTCCAIRQGILPTCKSRELAISSTACCLWDTEAPMYIALGSARSTTSCNRAL